MKNRKRIVLLAAIVIVVIAAFFVIRGIINGRSANSTWQTVKLERGELVAIVGATGTVRSNQSAVMAWQTSGKIKKAYAVLDQQVSSDFILAELDQASLPQSVILAEADLVTARRNLETLKT